MSNQSNESRAVYKLGFFESGIDHYLTAKNDTEALRIAHNKRFIEEGTTQTLEYLMRVSDGHFVCGADNYFDLDIEEREGLEALDLWPK